MRKKFLAGLLAHVMLLSLVPVTAFAAEADTTSNTKAENGMVLTKTAQLQSDGTYTINLEAFATGTTTTTPVETKVPLDIVLVLDQSGSMKNSISVGTTQSYEKLTNGYNNSTSNSTAYSNRNNLYVQLSDGTYSKVTITRVTISEPSYDDWDGSYKYTYAADGMTTVTTKDDSAYSNAPWTLYTLETDTTTMSKHDALVDAANTFIASVQSDAATYDVDHRMAIVGFASTGSSYTNTELLSTSDVVNYGSATNSDYAAAMVSVNNNGTTNTRLTTAIDRLATDGDTYSEYGFDMANKIFAQNSIEGTNRKRLVVMFTDGYTAPSGTNDFQYSMANNAINYANTSKTTYSATVYSIAVVDGADPTADITTNFQTSDGWSGGSNNLTDAQELVAMNRYMHYTSSNYTGVTSLQSTGTRVSGKNCYLVASNAASLNSIFESVFEDEVSSSTTVTLTESAVMRDIMTPGAFQLPAGFNAASQITVQTQVVETTDGENYIPTPGAVTTYTSTDGINFVNGDKTITISANTETDTVDVSGFNYSEKFVAPSHPGEKLMITIRGIEATEGAATGETVSTNDETSGIYQDDKQVTPIVAFPTPDTIIPNKSYVLDYAKPFGIDASNDWGSTGISHLGSSMAKITTPSTSLDLTNGSVSASGTTLTYTPETMSWNKYDKFFTFGTQGENIYQWAKVNVIPANNIYYEDTFVTTETDENGNATTANVIVGIVYNANNSTVTTDGTTDDNTGEAETGVHGWVTSLADDAAYSDGSATKMTTGATATFTFTGTGVDIYSYTDMTTGIVTAKISGAGLDATKYLMVDNLAVSGEYYQIPTLFFNDLPYGTYTVTLVVNSAMAPEKNDDGSVKLDAGNIVYSDTAKRTTYYLDGIRVYNPVQSTDETVQNAYGEEELNAVFKGVRELMAEDTATDGDTGTVFIDLNGTVGKTGDYEAGEYGTYGPKNEVYLAPGQSITFKVDGNSGNYYQIGLKAPEGATYAAFSNTAESNSGTEIAHSTDLYYKVPPVDGMITIKNTGVSNILSVTKVKMTGADTTSGIALLSLTEEEATAEFTAFTLRSTVEYTTEVEEEVLPEEPEVPEEPETPVEPEAPVEPEEPEVPDIDVDIDNPDPEPEQKPEQKPQHNNHKEELKKLVDRLFNKIFGWFGR